MRLRSCPHFHKSSFQAECTFAIACIQKTLCIIEVKTPHIARIIGNCKRLTQMMQMFWCLINKHTVTELS